MSDGTWVIFEGPDGAGKTTLAQQTVAILTEKSPTVSQHLTNHSDFSEYYYPVRTWIGHGLNVVQDRCALSDLVYAPVLSGVSSRFGEQAVRQQLQQINHRGLIIHVTAEEATLAERLNTRGDDLVDEGMLHALCKNYWQETGWWSETGATILTIDTTDEFPDRLCLELMLSVGFESIAHERGG